MSASSTTPWVPGFLADVLSQGHNYELTLAIETAVKMGLPPRSLLIATAQPTDDWTIEDKKLVIAFTVLDKQRCGKCGQPLWICRSMNNNLDFSVKVGTCYVEKALEDRKKKDSKRKDGGLKDGQFYYTEPIMRGDKPLPTRQEWLDDMREE